MNRSVDCYRTSLEDPNAPGFSRDQFGRQSMSEKRHASLDAKSTDTYQRNKKLRSVFFACATLKVPVFVIFSQRVNDPLFYFLSKSFTGRRESGRSSRKPNSRLLRSQPKRTCLLQVRKLLTHLLAKENRLLTAVAYLLNDSVGLSAFPYNLFYGREFAFFFFLLPH